MRIATDHQENGITTPLLSIILSLMRIATDHQENGIKTS